MDRVACGTWNENKDNHFKGLCKVLQAVMAKGSTTNLVIVIQDGYVQGVEAKTYYPLKHLYKVVGGL